ncbi:DUF202 domain-containing protein [Aquipuribacter nitratireducens]|uniref:DUF202 domain-containing protein n=1 Tax=Aquipuribacter nitratireducens TaxID=650104 RepID=A0ABW0GHN4_9MICO
MTGALFDPGLQPERTRLAWRRTTLTLLVGAVASTRLLAPLLGAWALAVGTAGVVACLALWSGANRRARAVDRALATGEHLPGAGPALLAVAIATASAAVLGVVVVAGGVTVLQP